MKVERRRIGFLILVMGCIVLVSGVVSIRIIYRAAIKEQAARLVETAQSQARLLEAVARYDAGHSRDYPGGFEAATLSQMRDAFSRYPGLGKTGEFTLAKKTNGSIVYLLTHRNSDPPLPGPIPLDSANAIPMRRALSGLSGTIIDLDYRGVKVLAAFEPVAELNWGIVAKIDLSEIQGPFVRAAFIAGAIALLLILLGAQLFVRIFHPMLKRIHESEQRFRVTFDQAAVGITHVAPDGNFLRVNRRFGEIVGYTWEEILDLTFQEITHPDDLDADLENMRRLREGILPTYSMEKRYRRKDGSDVWVNLTVSCARKHGGELDYYITAVEDISKRKRAEERIRASLEEKDVLLKEIHHRVKNNLQVITSLLNLQAGRIDHEPSIEAFEACKNRISSMALVHEKFYRSENFARIDFKDYVASMARELSWLYDAGSDIAVEVDIADVTLNIQTAIPCGLIINELLTNALKHAFPAKRKGRIRVAFSKTGEAEYELIVEDNGIGIPGTVDLEAKETLGLQLVRVLIRQMDGTLELSRNKGTAYRIRLSDSSYKQGSRLARPAISPPPA